MDFNSENNNESTYRNAFEEFLRQQSAENDFKESVTSTSHIKPLSHSGCETPNALCKCSLQTLCKINCYRIIVKVLIVKSNLNSQVKYLFIFDHTFLFFPNT